MSTCRSCGAEIIWADSENGRPMPLDAEPVEIPRGLFALVGQEGTATKRARSVGKVYRSHFATCPHADEHRRRRDSDPLD